MKKSFPKEGSPETIFFGTVLALNMSKSREQTFYHSPGFTAGQFRKVVNSFTEFIGADTRRKES